MLRMPEPPAEPRPSSKKEVRAGNMLLYLSMRPGLKTKLQILAKKAGQSLNQYVLDVLVSHAKEHLPVTNPEE